MYLIDETKWIWSKVLKASEVIEIRLPLGSGIAGYERRRDKFIAMMMYNDAQFDPLIDKRQVQNKEYALCTGERKERKILGVFQLLNKRNGVFSDDDVQLAEALSVHVAIAITNAR